MVYGGLKMEPVMMRAEVQRERSLVREGRMASPWWMAPVGVRKRMRRWRS